MSSFQMTKHVAAPVDVVFDIASDLAHATEHVRGIEKIELLTSGPIGVGTKWRETRRMMAREATETLEITAFDRPRTYTVGCDSCGCYFQTVFQFEPHAGGTAVTLEVTTKAQTFMAKLMSPIGNLMMGKVMRKCIEDDLDDVKRVAESRVATSAS